MLKHLKYADMLGRILISLIFLVSGVNKLTSYADTLSYMQSAGVPGFLLPVVIAVEILGALAIIVGWHLRWAALALAGFSLLTALLFHLDFSNQMQTIMFLKNLAIAGGFLVLFANGAGELGLDGRHSQGDGKR
jgi:putative oxidoreductase